MAITTRGQVGPQVVQDGAEQAMRLGRSAEQIFTELHGKYYETSFRGNVFTAANGSTGNLLVGSTVASVHAFTLANPAGSGKNLSLIRFEAIHITVPATPVVGGYALAVNTNTVAAAVTGTAITATPSLIGSNNAPVGKPLSASTLPAAPTLFRLLATKLSTAATASQFIPAYSVDFDGTAVLTPGSAISLVQVSTDATNAAMTCQMTWEENPV